MTALRRAGARWRLLAHTYEGGQPRYGDAYHVDSAGEWIGPGRRRWRAQSKPIHGTPHHTHELHLPHTEFDELVVGRWLHVEQMDTGMWSIDVGGVTVHVWADREGRPDAVAVFGPNDYAAPVEGCSYSCAWTHLPAGETR